MNASNLSACWFLLLFVALCSCREEVVLADDALISQDNSIVEQAEVLLRQARQGAGDGGFDAAEKLLRTQMKATGESPDLWVALGKVEIERFLNEAERASTWSKVPDSALDRFSKALVIDSEHRPALLGIASVYDLRGERQLATQIYQKLLAARPDDAVMQKLVGTGLLAQGEYNAASAVLEQAVEGLRSKGDQPQELLSTIEQLGRAYQGAGEMEKAEELLLESVRRLEALKQEGQTEFAACPYVALGQLYRRSGDDELGVEMFVRAAEQEPNRANSQHDAALYLFYAGDLERAMTFVERAVDVRGDVSDQELKARIREAQQKRARRGDAENTGWLTADAAFDAAVRAYDRYDFAQAHGFVDQALELEKTAPHMALKGWLLLLDARFEEAQTLFLTLHSEPSSQLEAEISLAHFDLAQRNYEQAEERLELVESQLVRFAESADAASQAEGWSWLLYKMGRLAMAWSRANQAEHAEAVVWFDRVLQFQPSDRFSLIGKGNSLNALGQLDDAETLMRRVLEGDPKNPYALAELGLVYLNRGDEAAAEASFEQARAQAPETYTCPYEGLGMVYLRQGQTAKAERAFQKAIEINPDIEFEKFNGLARIYLDQGRLEEAEALLLRSIANHPYDPEAKALLAELKKRVEP